MTTQHRLQAKRLHYSGKKLGKFETVVFALKARWICALSNSPLGLNKKRGRKVRSIFELQIGQSTKSTALSLTMSVKTYPCFRQQNLGTILQTYSIIKSEIQYRSRHFSFFNFKKIPGFLIFYLHNHWKILIILAILQM